MDIILRYVYSGEMPEFGDLEEGDLKEYFEKLLDRFLLSHPK